MKKFDVLFVIVTYNAMNWVDSCIGSIRNTNIDNNIRSVKTYIIDNGSTDGTQDYIKSHYPEVILYQSDHNLGFGQGNNVGIQYAMDYDYDYVYLLNQDAWVLPDTVEKLIDINLKHPEFGVLGPFQMQANETYLDENFLKNTCSYQNNENILNDIYFGVMDDAYPVPNVMAAHWLMSKACIKKVGGFSPTFLQYGEDGNYSDRAYYHGFKIGITPSVRAVHDRELRKDSVSKMIKLHYMNMLKMYSYLYFTPRLSLFSIFLHLAGLIIKRRSLTPIECILDLLKRRSLIIRNRKISMREYAFLKNNNCVHNF